VLLLVLKVDDNDEDTEVDTLLFDIVDDCDDDCDDDFDESVDELLTLSLPAALDDDVAVPPPVQPEPSSTAAANPRYPAQSVCLDAFMTILDYVVAFLT